MNVFYLLGLSSGIVSAVSFVPYVRDILKGTTRPERASWLIWSTLGSIAFFSQWAAGARDSLWMTGIQTAGVLLISFLSIKHGEGGLVRRDVISLICAGFGLVLWYFTKQPAAALLITVAIDAVGVMLVILKSYEDPESETVITWILAGLGGLLGALSVGRFDPLLLLYPIYIFTMNSAVVLAIFLGKRKLRKNNIVERSL
jgi:hypothetical protein